MISVALIGYGYWGPNLLRNLVESGECESIYCCDFDVTKLQEINRKYPNVITSQDPENIFKNSDIHAVVIATPTDTHFNLAQKALENQKDVLIEKPMVATVEEAKNLISLAKKTKRILMIDHTFLFNDAVIKIKQLLKKGAIGDVLYVESNRVNLGLLRKDVNVIYDLASHDFAIIQYLLEIAPRKVYCHTQTYFGKQEEVAFVHVEYKDKMFANINVSWLSPLKKRELIIVGTKRMVVYDDINPSEKIRIYDKGVTVLKELVKDEEQLKIGYRSGDVWMPKTDVVEPLSLLIKEFVNSVKTRKTPKSDGRFGMEIVKLVESSTNSARTGESVLL